MAIRNKNVASDAAISLSKIAGGGVGPGMGRILYVCPSTSPLYDRWSNEVPAGDLFLTLAAAYAQTVTNRNDVIILAPEGHALTSMLSVTKRKVHFLGADVGGKYYGQRARITMGDSTTAADIALVQVTGQAVSFTNIKFDSSSTVAASLYTVADGGEYTQFTNCEFYKSTDLDEDDAAELLCNGDSSKYEGCTIGSNANAITATGARPCVLLTTGTISGKSCRDVTFKDCFFWRNAGEVANSFIHSAGAADVERMLLFKDCLFFNTKLAAASMANGLTAAASLTVGYILLKDCTIIGADDFANATGIYNASGAANAVNGGEAIQAT